MTNRELLERISANPMVMVGKPVITGTRLTVEYILNLLAHGASQTGILGEYKNLVPEDIQACLLFAARALESLEFVGNQGEAPEILDAAKEAERRMQAYERGEMSAKPLDEVLRSFSKERP